MPLSTLWTNLSWNTAAPPSKGDQSVDILWALASSLSLLVVLGLGVHWSIGAKWIITSPAFYGAVSSGLLIGLLTAIPSALLLLAQAGEAETGKDPSAIAGTGSAYFLPRSRCLRR